MPPTPRPEVPKAPFDNTAKKAGRPPKPPRPAKRRSPMCERISLAMEMMSPYPSEE